MSLSSHARAVSVKEKPNQKEREHYKYKKWQQMNEQADSKQHEYYNNNQLDQVKEHSHNNTMYLGKLASNTYVFLIAR